MLKFFRRFFIIFFVVFILNIQICYCEDFNIYFFERIFDFNNNFNETAYYCYDNDIYHDIKGCSLQNHILNRKVSYFSRVVNFVNFFFSIGWSCCGIIGFFWLLWAYNRIHTGGAEDHD